MLRRLYRYVEIVASFLNLGDGIVFVLACAGIVFAVML